MFLLKILGTDLITRFFSLTYSHITLIVIFLKTTLPGICMSLFSISLKMQIVWND